MEYQESFDPYADAIMSSFLLWTGVGLAVTFIIVYVFLRARTSRREEASKVAKPGVPAAAYVKAIHPTGTTFDDEPEVRITLDVRPERGESFMAVVTTRISVVYLPSFQPGAIVPACFDPNDRTNVTLFKP